MFFFAPSAGEFGGFLEGKIFFGNHFGVFARKLPIFYGKFDIPSGKRLHNELGRSTIFHGKTHYFDWAIFNSLGTAAMNSYGYLWLSISLALLAQRPTRHLADSQKFNKLKTV